MVKIANNNFSLSQICDSGQCFRMTGDDGIFSVVAFGKYLEMRQNEDFVFLDCTDDEYESIWKDYFDLTTDYNQIISDIDKNDDYLIGAAKHGVGIRILKQDLWEMIISFIISQQNNIKRIRKCINILCERYGEEKISANGVKYYDFPTPEALSNVTIEELNECNLGYRSRYIHETAMSVCNGNICLDSIKTMSYEEAKNELLKLCGVGIKVAECVCLFSLHHTQAFPIDTHIKKVVENKYPDGFPFEKYGANSGILQQYIFFYDLFNGK